MSRSYKKYPGWKDGDCGKRWVKRQANKRVRRTANLDSGGAYKKVYQQWYICDFNCRYYDRADVYKDYEDFGFRKPYKYWMK